MTSIFRDCINLISLNFSLINSNKLTDIQSVFFGCESLTSIDLSSSNFSSVIITRKMFYSCTNLEYLTLPNHMISLQNAESMFESCSNIKYINLDFLEYNHNFTKANNMFINCINLLEIKFPEVYSVLETDLTDMFSGCINIRNIDLRKYEVKYVYAMSQMFRNCKKLEYIDIYNLNMTNVHFFKKYYIFEGVGKNTTENVIIIYNEHNVDEDIEYQIKQVTNKLSL